MTITYYKDGFLYTCGHCFPKNAYTEYGDLVYSSGFDTKTEGQEIAIIKIIKEHQKKFKYFDIINKPINPKRYQLTIMINNNILHYGKILKKIKKKLNSGWVTFDKFKVNHQITKLDPPYYLVLSNIKPQTGLSGSPWIISHNNNLYLLGSHIGKTNGKLFEKDIQISYVKPLDNYDIELYHKK